MRAYTKRLYFAIETARSVSAAVPAGMIWVVRDIDCVPGMDVAMTVAVGVAPGLWFWVAHLDNLSGVRHGQWQGRQVLEAGEMLDVYATAQATFMVTGYELGV